jgi:hemolysin activation/secretion protein
LGWHFRANLYTPYWDPECGVWVDAMAAVGQVRMPEWTNAGQFRVELAGVHKLPFCGPFGNVLAAMRVVGMGALPDQGQFFALGGGTLFRGYDLAERQGSSLWVGNFELRLPLVRDAEWDALDHTVGARNAWLAAFYDVGQTYANGRTVGGTVAHALGAGLRVDVAVFSFIERATLRFDVAKTINDNTPFQFWFGVQHAF